MENRDSIIRKLNALRAKAYDKSIADTPEAISAMVKFNELMQRYNLTLTDLEVKSAKIGGFSKTTTKATDYMRYMVIAIADVTNTEVVKAKADTYLFLGTLTDCEYANWLYDLISYALENNSVAYKISPDYHKRINNGEKGETVMKAFRDGFCYAIVSALDELKNTNKGTGTSLMVLKNDLIVSFMQDQGIPTQKRKTQALKVQDNHLEVMHNGYKEGSKVKFRKEIE